MTTVNSGGARCEVRSARCKLRDGRGTSANRATDDGAKDAVRLGEDVELAPGVDPELRVRAGVARHQADPGQVRILPAAEVVGRLGDREHRVVDLRAGIRLVRVVPTDPD